MRGNTGTLVRLRAGRVLRTIDSRPGLIELVVAVEGAEAKAIAYEAFTGRPAPGDEVLLNTTAVAEGLGSGGYHFVVAGLLPRSLEAPEKGHIMKLRYTPAQIKVMAVEEPDSPFHSVLENTADLGGVPVVALELHSQLAPVAAALWRQGGGRLRLVYVMTDGAALPLAFSRTVHALKGKGLLSATVTAGHAFGGDFEAVNVYSGLLAARYAGEADVIVVGMGPGVVGTGTRFGTTAIEQGEVVNAAGVLNGKPVAALRLSFADRRERHRGVSHHTLTALGSVALVPCAVPVPVMETEKTALVLQQLDAVGITRRHRLETVDATGVFDTLDELELKVSTMGRGRDEETEFFLAAGAAGVLAAKLALAEA
ncbi:MAG: DUF3866 family protein [Bacillota bacterium]